MGLRLLYLYRNLTRNPLRTLLTCASVGLPIMIFVLSVGVIDGVERFLENGAKQLRLAVTHKASIINPLPEGHRRKIEALDPSHKRIIAVCGMHWIGGQAPNDPRKLSTLGADTDTFPLIFPDYHLTPDQLHQWQTERRAIVVGSATARQFGWKVGDRITIKPSIPPYEPLEFIVVSTAEGATDALTNWFHREYFEEEIKGTDAIPGWISFFFVKCATKADLDHYRTAIDDAFKGSTDETLTQDEKTFMTQFISQQFDLPTKIRILAGITIFVAIIAAANTMSMSFRDRISEYATLKSMGFGGGTIFGLVQTEAVLLCGLGGLLGTLIPYIAFTYTPMRDYTLPVIAALRIRPQVCVIGLLASFATGILAALWPSWLALRLHVVTALRNLE